MWKDLWLFCAKTSSDIHNDSDSTQCDSDYNSAPNDSDSDYDSTPNDSDSDSTKLTPNDSDSTKLTLNDSDSGVGIAPGLLHTLRLSSLAVFPAVRTC